MIDIMLAEDHEVVRAGLRVLLEMEPDFRVVAEASDGRQVQARLDEHQPHILLLDLSLPGLGGLALIRRLRSAAPALRILVLSMHADPAYVGAALHAGADGYVPKCAPPGELQRGIRSVLAGAQFVGAPLVAADVRSWMARRRDEPVDPVETLTPREREAFQLAAEGQTNPEIAGNLGISVRTAESHRAAVLRKLGVRSHAELVRFAIDRGWIPPSPPPPPP